MFMKKMEKIIAICLLVVMLSGASIMAVAGERSDSLNPFEQMKDEYVYNSDLNEQESHHPPLQGLINKIFNIKSVIIY